MQFGILGNGSWGTALAKLLTDNGNTINWWNRSEKAINTIKTHKRNPLYLPSAIFDVTKLNLSSDINLIIAASDILVIAIPSAFAESVLDNLDKKIFDGKIILSAIKGILPGKNVLLNDYLKDEFDFPLEKYYTVMGPCHAEEVAAKKLSYLTFSGLNKDVTILIADSFKTNYLKTVINNDLYGVQYAAVLKNIYAIGAGIATGLGYGDNFLSVLIANSADEMAGLLRKAGILNAEMGYIDHSNPSTSIHTNYAASVYMGDLLVTCYSIHSRNRTFGTMVGKGYSVEASQSEMKMVAEGYNASKCMNILNKTIKAEIPIADTIYNILWQGLEPAEGFKKIEECLV